MAKKKEKRKQIRKKLLHKYRLVILNESTFEEKLSFKLSRLNVFVTGMLAAIGLIALTTLLIAFTPLREYIPGYSSTRLKRQATELTYKTDSLVTALDYTNRYLDRIRMVLSGEVEPGFVAQDSVSGALKLDPSTVDLSPIREDSLLRQEVALEDKYNLFQPKTNGDGILFFSPLKGQVTDAYAPEQKHYGIDLVAPKDTPVKAVANGTVIFAEWTADTGYVVILEHQEGYLSAYKHNSALHKEQGDLVRTGEVIATVGNTGKYTTGDHLHFELWRNGTPVNPLDYIDFN